MEEKILEIINQYAEKSFSENTACASVITAHVMDFIEWKDSFTSYDAENVLYLVEIETHIIELMDIEGVYQYWLTNIYKA